MRVRGYHIFFMLGVFLLLNSTTSMSQGEVISQVKAAMKAGSSRELTKLLYKSTSLDIEGDRSSYSKAQAEVILKDFFGKYPPNDFRIVHQGASRAGSPFVIGQYLHSSGSFRVWIRLKEEDKVFLVHEISFHKD